MVKKIKNSVKLKTKEKARSAHEKAIEKILKKSRSVLAQKDKNKSVEEPLHSLPDLKTGQRGIPAGNHIPAGGGYAKDIFYAYKWKRGKEERTDTILEIEERRKRVRYAFRKEGKMYGFDPFKQTNGKK